MRRSPLLALATAAIALAAPAAAAAQASLSVDPVKRCYREQDEVQLLGTGFTPNAPVAFTREDASIGEPIPADASGALVGNLTLPGLVSGQERLTYVATDATNPQLVAQATLLVTATNVGMRPGRGRADRLLKIRGRGFFGGRRVWAHVVRTGRPARTARNVAIGRVKGACKKVRARKRLFPASAAVGTYHVQFDTFRRYKRNRRIEWERDITVSRSAR